MSTLFDNILPFNKRQVNTLREQLQKSLERIPIDGNATDWADVYIPDTHLQAIDPQRMVVEGMRGSGKTFWTEILTKPEIRSTLAKEDIGYDLKMALSNINESHQISLNQGKGSSGRNFPEIIEIDKLLQLPGVKPEIIWMVAILHLFPIDEKIGMPQSNDEYDKWTEAVSWAGLNPSRLSKGLELIDKKLTENNKMALVIIDAIDCASHDLHQVSAMGAGLLRVLLDFRFAKGLRIKAFFREDVLSRASRSVVDGSKLLNNKVVLRWSESELYGLAFHRIAQKSSYFREQFKRKTVLTWRKDNNFRYSCDGAKKIDIQKFFWRSLVGDYMGESATKGHTYPYIFKHLGDGLGRVAPRTFLVALREALLSTVNSHANEPYVIHHEAIKDGVRKASVARTQELTEEYAWITPALQCIQAKKETVPIDRTTLEAIWLENNAEVLNDIEAMRGSALIPWPSNASTTSKIESLRSTLEQIGIIKSRIKGNDERIEIPDIYRLAYKIGRKGGIATRKKP